MSSLLDQLRSFCADIGQGQHRPQQRWVREVLFGVLGSRSLMLSEIARSLSELDREGKPRRLIHTEKRLSRNLNSDRLDDEALRRALYRRAGRFTTRDDGEGVVVAVDYTDIAKPYARPDNPRGMELVCRCRDGSRGRTGMGYPVVQIEASLPDGNRVPLVYEPFSFASKRFSTSSQNTIFLSAVERTAPHVGPRAWWTMDRGFDNRRLFHGFDQAGVRWICRMQIAKNTRSVVLKGGKVERVYDVALQTNDRYTHTIAGKRGRKTQITFGAKPVHVSDGAKRKPAAEGPARTLITVWGFGRKPLVLLVSEAVKGKRALLEAVLAYVRRWKCEEATRAMKESRGWGVRLEDVRALKFRGIQRMVLMASIVYLFLAELRDVGGQAVNLALAAVRAFGAPPPDMGYRLLRGIGSLLQRLPRWVTRRWIGRF